MSFDNLKLVKSSKLPYEMDVHVIAIEKDGKILDHYYYYDEEFCERHGISSLNYIKNVLDWDNSVKKWNWVHAWFRVASRKRLPRDADIIPFEPHACIVVFNEAYYVWRERNEAA